jgi:hypothetical protein
MGLVFRTILIWLVVLAVPAQGAAAVTMASCGPNHQGGVPTGSTLHSGASAHAQHGEGGHAHGVDASASASATAPAPAPAPAAAPFADSEPASPEAGHASPQKCSACASCCSLGAIPTPGLVILSTEPAPTVFVTVVTAVDAFAADGPDRPPRHVIA